MIGDHHQPWYRGAKTDWLRAVVVSLGLGIAGWLSFYLQGPNMPDIEGAWNLVQAVPWRTALIDGSLYGSLLTPLTLLAIRWWYAGEPLPDQLRGRGYLRELYIGTAMQVSGGIFLWILYFGFNYSGEQLVTFLETLPPVAMWSVVLWLNVSLLGGIVLPPVAMYLDARYIGTDGLLSVDDTPLLHWIPLLGVQFMGIPTLAAVYYYRSRRKKHTIDVSGFP